MEVPDLDLLDLGFDVPEIDLAIAEAGGGDKEETSIPQGPAVSRPGDLWLMGKHRLLAGSALEHTAWSNVMADKRAAGMFTDPPYNVEIDGFVSGAGRRKHREFAMGVGEMSEAEFTAFLSQVFEQAVRFSDGGAVHFICMDWRHLRELLAAGYAHYGALLNMCVWVKDRAGMGSCWRSQHELVFAWRVGAERAQNHVRLGRFGRNRTNVWSFPSAATFMAQEEGGELLRDHPTPKPVSLVAEALLDCTARGEIVVDPFLGSGTTLIAAEKTGRSCYGIELDPLYVDLIVRRWEAWTGERAVHEGTGLTFAELAAARAEERHHD